MKLKTLLAVTSTALIGFASGQTSIVQTLNFSGVPDFSTPLSFAKYSGNLADLTSILVSYSMTIQGGEFVVDNDSAIPATTTATFGSKLSATSGQVIILNNSFQPIISNVSVNETATFNLGAENGDGALVYDPTGPDGGKMVGGVATGSGSGSVNSLFWSGYVGAGNFTINAATQQEGTLTYSSGIQTATTPRNVNGTITVTYNTNLVPEPSAMALSGLAVLGLALRRRRA